MLCASVSDKYDVCDPSLEHDSQTGCKFNVYVCSCGYVMNIIVDMNRFRMVESSNRNIRIRV